MPLATDALKAAVLPDRSVLSITGPDTRKFLQGMITNDIRRLAPERQRVLYTGFLTAQGKLLHDAFLIDDGERILIDIATDFVAGFVKRLTAFRLREAVEFGEATPAHGVAAAWGAAAAAKLGLDDAEGTMDAGAAAKSRLAFVDPRLAALGTRLVYPADNAAIEADLGRLGFDLVTSGDYAAHRVALGIADTTEIGGEILYPLEANFEVLHGVDFRKGCYIGQELTARMRLKGELRKRILPVTGATALPAIGTMITAQTATLGPLIAASGTEGLALLRMDRLAEAQEDGIRAGDVQLAVHRPDWLSPDE